MTPAALQLALFILQEAIRLEPSIAAEVSALLQKPNPTAADWEALRTRITLKTYWDDVPASALPRPAAPVAAPLPAPAPAP